MKTKYVILPGSKKVWIVTLSGHNGLTRVTGMHRVLGVPVYSQPSPSQRAAAIEMARSARTSASCRPD
jgi:hypothetical protein